MLEAVKRKLREAGYPDHWPRSGTPIQFAPQPGTGPDDKPAPWLADQMRQALIRLVGVMQAQGAAPGHLVSMRWTILDIEELYDHFEELDLLVREIIGGNLPVVEVVVADAAFDVPGQRVTVGAEVDIPPPAGDAPVHGGYSFRELTWQYAPRAQVGEVFFEFMEQGRILSDAFRAKHKGHLDLAYGPTRWEKLDVFPTQAGAPLHIFIHGGYWQAQDKAHCHHYLAALADAGIATAAINYTLCPPGNLDRIVDEVRRGVAFLWREAARFGYDRDRIHVSGHSAGAHLAAMVAATDWSLLEPAMPQATIRSAGLISGLFDLEPVRLTAANRALRLDEATARRNSPVRLWPARQMPLLVAVGGDESAEFRRQSLDFAKAWDAAGCRVETAIVEGTHHFDVIEEMMRAGQPTAEWMIRIARETSPVG